MASHHVVGEHPATADDGQDDRRQPLVEREPQGLDRMRRDPGRRGAVAPPDEAAEHDITLPTAARDADLRVLGSRSLGVDHRDGDGRRRIHGTGDADCGGRTERYHAVCRRGSLRGLPAAFVGGGTEPRDGRSPRRLLRPHGVRPGSRAVEGGHRQRPRGVAEGALASARRRAVAAQDAVDGDCPGLLRTDCRCEAGDCVLYERAVGTGRPGDRVFEERDRGRWWGFGHAAVKRAYCLAERARQPEEGPGRGGDEHQ